MRDEEGKRLDVCVGEGPSRTDRSMMSKDEG